MFPFALGISLLALLLGFLVGASSSPVAGVAVTAGFGVAAAALAFMQARSVGDTTERQVGKSTKETRARALSIDTLNSVGRVLIVFSVAFGLGIALGIWTRSSRSAASTPVDFPWKGATAPASAREAIDWVVVHRNLRRMGYTDSQVEELYRIDAVRKKSESFSIRGEGTLSSIFIQQKLEDPSQGNLIANQPPPRDPSLFNNPFPTSPVPGSKEVVG